MHGASVKFFRLDYIKKQILSPCPPPHNFLTRIATKNPFAANEIGLTVNRNSFLWHYHLKHRLLQNPLRGLGHGAKQTHVLFGT